MAIEENEKDSLRLERRLRLSDTLYRRMVAAGMDQTRLAEASGVPRDAVCRYLLAVSEPRPGNLKKLARGLGCTVSEIIYEAEGVLQQPTGLLLSHSEIQRLTGKMRRSTQKEVLDSMGISYRENGIGELAVSRKHVERVLDDGQRDYPGIEGSQGAPNFAALEG